MSTTQWVQPLSLPVAADYSAKQNYWMTYNSSGQAQLAATRGVACIGVLQDDPDAAGKVGSIAFSGKAKVYLGGTVAKDDPITNDANGATIKATLSTDHIHGKAIGSGSSGQYIDVLLSTAALKGVALDGRAIYEDFSAYAATDQVANVQPDGTAADGSTGVLNHCYTPGGLVFGYAALGAGQTITGPVITATGLNIAGDQTADEGYDIFTHFLGASGMGPFVIGQSPAFYFRCKIQVADISGTDDLQIGFRRAEIVNAAFDNYLDAAAFSVDAADGTLSLETILNNGATTTTDTTDTLVDDTAYEFKILVAADGVVTYQHDIASSGTLAAPTAVAVFTFDDGDPVIPFVRFLHDTDLAGQIDIHIWDVGYQN